MFKRFSALVLALFLVLTLFSACGGDDAGKESSAPPSLEAGTENSGSEDSSSSEESQPETPAVDTSEHMNISIFMQADDVAEGDGEENPVILYWADMFNITVEWQKPPQGSEQEQLTMMLGTGDYTDVIDISFNTENPETLCEDGAIYELSQYIDQYMPNYKAFLEANPDVKSALYDDNGHIYNVATVQENPKQWGGLVYRRDILETMTGGQVAFPSGTEDPSTIEDWEYMLDLMKKYFDASGMPETAGLDYIDNDGKAKYGIAEDAFYNYLTKMREWYEKGYIYADFASRSQDLFYLPNTALTYGGAAGSWYGLTANLGGAMSLPEYDLEMDVRPLAAPTDTANGVTTPLGIYLDSGRASNHAGFMISTACDEDKTGVIFATPVSPKISFTSLWDTA